MSSDIITDVEVSEFLVKGEQRAATILSKAPKNSFANKTYLQDQFASVSKAAAMLLDNFDLQKFNKRENYKLPADSLKHMLLASFEAVRCLELIEDAIGPRDTSLTAYGAKIALTKAVSVYASNGDNDVSSLCATRMLDRKFPARGDTCVIERHCA